MKPILAETEANGRMACQGAVHVEPDASAGRRQAVARGTVPPSASAIQMLQWHRGGTWDCENESEATPGNNVGPMETRIRPSILSTRDDLGSDACDEEGVAEPQHVARAESIVGFLSLLIHCLDCTG